ncbi:hypothetical protein [Streptomyces sp. NPDC047525]|uniref:hypothetical protein n=1 Tax=Streptomyces sp. NPDC047525 TaxID=3155264 RepID=UPI0033F32707
MPSGCEKIANGNPIDLFNPATPLGCAAERTAEKIVDSAFSTIVDSFAQGAALALKSMTTGWMNLDAPDISQAGPVGALQNSLSWVTAWVAVLALLIAAGRMIWQQRGEPLKEAMGAVIKLVLVSSVGIVAIQTLMRAGDSFSNWILMDSLGCGGETPTKGCSTAFGKRIIKLVAKDAEASMMAITLVTALLIMISSFIQMCFMMARNAMLILLVGTLPLSAAAAGTEAGRGWFQKTAGWIVAFLLFKPAAAIVYAAAFNAIGKSKVDDLWSQLYGVLLLILASLTLPALMRFITPMVAAAAAGGGAGAAIAGGVRGAATGAVAIKSMGASKAGGAAAKGASGAAQAGGGKSGGQLPAQPSPSSGPPGGDSSAGKQPVGVGAGQSAPGQGQAHGATQGAGQGAGQGGSQGPGQQTAGSGGQPTGAPQGGRGSTGPQPTNTGGGPHGSR